MLDLLIAGAGPAGLATAIHAARAGLRVAVAEPRTSPIDKACGEGLMPTGVRALRELGADVAGHPLRGIRYLDGRHRAEALFPAGHGLGVRRTELQAALAARAAELDVPILPVRVDGITQYGDRVVAAGLAARYLVAADGLHSPIRHRLGLHRPVPGRAARYGLRRHFALAPWTDRVEVHWSARAEAYVTPLAPDLVGVALLTSERSPFDALLGGFPELAARLTGCRAVTPVRGAGPMRQHVRARVLGRVLLVGDAAGYLDALTGEGLTLALTTAARLVDCLTADRPEQYEREWEHLSRRYRWLTGSLLWARARPALAPLIVPAAARLPSVFAAAVGQLA